MGGIVPVWGRLLASLLFTPPVGNSQPPDQSSAVVRPRQGDRDGHTTTLTNGQQYMANIKSQKKRNRQTIRRTERNRALRSELRTRSKNALAAAESGDAAAAEEALRIAQVKIDKAVTKGILKKNTAARRKSTLTRQVRQKLG